MTSRAPSQFAVPVVRRPSMQPINYRRLALGGTIASAVLFLGSGALIGSQSARITAAREAARVPPYVPAPFLGAIEVLLFGFALIWLYAAIRPRFGAGPTAAARAGIGVWFLVIGLGTLHTIRENLGMPAGLLLGI